MLKSLEEIKEDFDSFLQNNQDKLVLVKFSAIWCPPCRDLQKNIQELLVELEKSAEQPNNLVVLEVDVEKFPKVAQRPQFSVRSLPTFFLFRQGEMVKEGHGSRSVQWLKEFVAV